MIEVRPAAQRGTSEQPGITSWHCFSAGAHYDADNIGFGPLIGFDEHLLGPGAGFGPHRHRGVEIVSWVLHGALRHTDATGQQGTLRPGVLGVQIAGTGVVHSEVNAALDAPLRFVQMTLLGDSSDQPDYRRAARSVKVRNGALSVHRSGALRTGPGRVHLFVTEGEFALGATDLRGGDAVRCTEPVTVSGRGELLVWALPA